MLIRHFNLSFLFDSLIRHSKSQSVTFISLICAEAGGVCACSGDNRLLSPKPVSKVAEINNTFSLWVLEAGAAESVYTVSLYIIKGSL